MEWWMWTCSFSALMLGSVCSGALEDILNTYQVLHHSDLRLSDVPLAHSHHVDKRSIYSREGKQKCHSKRLEFTTLGRHFNLELHCQRDLFDPDFSAVVIGKDGKSVPFHVNKEDFMEGFIVGDSARTKVIAYFEHKDLVARIETPEDTYIIEPSLRHLPKSTNYTMLAYKVSEMKLDMLKDPEDHMGHHYCGFVRPDGTDEAAYTGSDTNSIDVDLHKQYNNKGGPEKHRKKRATSTKNVCTLKLVADYRFFQNIGLGDIATTVNYLINTISWVNGLYRSHDFEGYTDLGFEIKEIHLHDEPTDVFNDEDHYNMERTVWDTKDLLKVNLQFLAKEGAFGKDEELDNFCLGHLFTYTSFSDGVLGLSWIGSPKVNSLGGICSPKSNGYYYNTAWSSTLNKFGRRILTQEAYTVTAHELGHSWGSEHDPATEECSPGSSNGGQHIMYTYSVTGYEENNKKFSPCSKRSIKAVLDNKKESCFTEKAASYCGNFEVEEPMEDCDAGPVGTLDQDPCCDKNCKFRSGALCSDQNSACCKNCQLAPSTTVCQEGLPGNLTCEGDAFCSGTDAKCGSPIAKSDGSPCIDKGSCSAGVCQPLCEYVGMISCICDSIVDSCRVCCKEKSNTTCEVYGQLTGDIMDLQDGKPCLQGYCESGTCVKQLADLSDRLWSIIENISVDSVVRFMRRNLVITIIVLSLLLYVPLCIIVACVDWRREKEDEEERKWHNRKNDQLVRGNNGAIRQTYTRRRAASRIHPNGGRNYNGFDDIGSRNNIPTHSLPSH